MTYHAELYDAEGNLIGMPDRFDAISFLHGGSAATFEPRDPQVTKLIVADEEGNVIRSFSVLSREEYMAWVRENRRQPT